MPQSSTLSVDSIWAEVFSWNFLDGRPLVTDDLWLPTSRQVARYWGDGLGVELLCAEGNGSDITVERFQDSDGIVHFALVNFWQRPRGGQEPEMWSTDCPISLYYRVRGIKDAGGAVPDTLMAKLKELMEAPQRRRRPRPTRLTVGVTVAASAATALIQTERARQNGLHHSSRRPGS